MKADEPADFDFEFDEGFRWLPSLRAHLAPVLPAGLLGAIAAAQAQRGPSAGEVLFAMAEVPALVELTQEWIFRRNVIGYHGTRLDEEQRAAVAKEGLRPLAAADRIEPLRRYLGRHPRWAEVERFLESAVEAIARDGRSREDQVHLTLSRAGLTRGFNHYLVEGSEFDRHVASRLFDGICHAENRARGRPILYRVRVAGRSALAAANPYGDTRMPNMVREMLQALAWSMETGRMDVGELLVDCGMVFREAVPPASILEAIELDDAALWQHYDHRDRD